MKLTKRVFQRLTSRSAREEGQVIIMVGLAALVLFAVVGLAVDIGRLYITKAQLSRAMDAAALAGVLELPNTTSAISVCEDYLAANEPTATSVSCTSPGENQLEAHARKEINTFFIRVVGVKSAGVSAKAKAGFGVAALDAALIIDATGSMDDGCDAEQDNAGCPVGEAKNAAQAFKDILLGSTPDGRTSVGATAFRGCFRAGTQTATAPMSYSAKPLCVLDDDTSSTWVTDLTYDKPTLESRIGNIMAQGGSGTNPCGGVAKGWEILNGPGNHLSFENNLRYLVLLSDGDSNYYGQYTYQSSPFASPHTYQTLPCQPPSSCSNVGGESSSSTYPCHDGVHVPATTLASDNFDGPSSSCPSTWSSGSGWLADWTRSPTSGNDAPLMTTSGSPRDTSCHALLHGVGSITRLVDLSTAASPSLSYYAKYSSWESGDDVLVQVSTDGTNWTTLRTHTTTNTGTSYGGAFSSDLTPYVGESNVRIRFLGSMSAGSTFDSFYVDTITITSGTPGSSNGYQNGQDGSPVGCSSARPRERQVDMLTWAMAKAVKADDVEIFVVGFGTCDPDSTVYTQAQCDAQIGNTDHDNTADERLLKCIASSKASTNDHYYYASSAASLPGIFSQIAAKIAHRLIE